MSACAECGMVLKNATEYHPYAACLAFKGCHNSEAVRANIDGVLATGHQNEFERGLEALRSAQRYEMEMDIEDGYDPWYMASPCPTGTWVKFADLEHLLDGTDRAWCGDCGAELEHVRPGKFQHIGPCSALKSEAPYSPTDSDDTPQLGR